MHKQNRYQIQYIQNKNRILISQIEDIQNSIHTKTKQNKQNLNITNRTHTIKKYAKKQNIYMNRMKTETEYIQKHFKTEYQNTHINRLLTEKEL